MSVSSPKRWASSSPATISISPWTRTTPAYSPTTRTSPRHIRSARSLQPMSPRCRNDHPGAQRAHRRPARLHRRREAPADSFSRGRGASWPRAVTSPTSWTPDAEVRVLLTAREEVRQARRTRPGADRWRGQLRMWLRRDSRRLQGHPASRTAAGWRDDHRQLRHRTSPTRSICSSVWSRTPSRTRSTSSMPPISKAMSWTKAMRI